MASEPLENDALDAMRDYAIGVTPDSPAGVEMSHADAVNQARIMVGRLVGEVDRLRAENTALRRNASFAAAVVSGDAAEMLTESLAKARAERDALAAKLDAVRAIEPTLRRIYATGIASEREVIDVVDELIGQALQESATTPPEGGTDE